MTGRGRQIPATKAGRHALIVQVLTHQQIKSQTELAEALAEHGLAVTQATLSRDLVELQAERTRGSTGSLIYAVPTPEAYGVGTTRNATTGQDGERLASRLSRLCVDLLVTAESSANLVVLRTPPGAAQFLASAIDQSVIPSLLGTIAGDDTVLLISREPDGGKGVADKFLSLAMPPAAATENSGS